MSLFDVGPFPFHDPWGRLLHSLLTSAYDVPSRIVPIVAEAGIPRSAYPNEGLSGIEVWYGALDAAARRGLVRELVMRVMADQSVAAIQPRLKVLLGQGDERALAEPERSTEPGQPAAERVIVGTIPAKPQSFIARDTVDELALLLVTGPAVIFGATPGRGVGKTQVAASYARRRIDDKWTLIGWVNAESRGRLVADMAAIAVALDVADPGGDSEKSAARLRDRLHARQSPGLIVFDNATDPDVLRDLLWTSEATQIVITSTDQTFDEVGSALWIDCFTRAESIRYLNGRTLLRGYDFDADRVAAELGDLPLALSHAAATIRRDRSSYRDYLSVLADVSIDELSGPDGEQYPDALAKVMTVQVRTIEGDDPSGHTSQVLRILAVLSPDGVPRQMLGPLTGALGLRPHELNGILGRCATGSVISWSVDGTVVLMHRVLGRVIRELDDAEDLDRSIGRGAQLLDSQLVPPDRAWADRVAASGQIDQIQALWRTLRPQADPVLRRKVLDLRTWAARQLALAADFRRAIDLGSAVLVAREQIFGIYDRETLMCGHYLAKAYHRVGRFVEAIALHGAVLRARERSDVLGPAHLDTLTSRNELADACYSAGRFDEVAALVEDNLPRCETVLGVDHPQTLTCRGIKANLFSSTDRPTEAICLYEANLADRIRVLGEDHPDTLISRNNLAFAYQAVSRLAEAIPLYETNLASKRRVLGDDHPDTINGCDNLGYAYHAAGRAADAVPLLEEVLRWRDRVLGSDDPQTAMSRAKLTQVRDPSAQPPAR